MVHINNRIVDVSNYLLTQHCKRSTDEIMSIYDILAYALARSKLDIVCTPNRLLKTLNNAINWAAIKYSGRSRIHWDSLICKSGTQS